MLEEVGLSLTEVGRFLGSEGQDFAVKAILGRAIMAGFRSCYQGGVGFCVWTTELSLELVVLGCQHLAGRSDLGSLHAQQAGPVWARSVPCRKL